MTIRVVDQRLKSINFCWLLIGILLFPCCGEGPPSEPPVVDRRFRTTPPARIYFQNIRSTAYQSESRKGDRTDYYILRDFTSPDQAPLLYPVIADIWMEDKAHILFRQPQGSSPQLPVRLYWNAKSDSGSYLLDTLSPAAYYDFALQIDESLRSAHQLAVSFAGSTARPLFIKDQHRNSFRRVIQDFLRLTE